MREKLLSLQNFTTWPGSPFQSPTSDRASLILGEVVSIKLCWLCDCAPKDLLILQEIGRRRRSGGESFKLILIHNTKQKLSKIIITIGRFGLLLHIFHPDCLHRCHLSRSQGAGPPHAWRRQGLDLKKILKWKVNEVQQFNSLTLAIKGPLPAGRALVICEFEIFWHFSPGSQKHNACRPSFFLFFLKGVLCEKPLGLNLSDVEDMVEKARCGHCQHLDVK